MQAPYFQNLRAGISAPRLDVYREAGDSDFDVISKYLWNVSLCEALYPALQTLEVALRNTIHQAAIGRFHREDWFDGPASPLHPEEKAALSLARAELGKQGKPTDTNRIVAELTFGFWVSLLNTRYEQKLWPRMLTPAFPGMPRRIRTRATLSKRLNEIRRLRNRAFHHERIAHWPNLRQCHRDIVETVGWINAQWSQVLAAADRFQETHRAGLAMIRGKLHETLGHADYVI
jgi:hypothetical protein